MYRYMYHETGSNFSFYHFLVYHLKMQENVKHVKNKQTVQTAGLQAENMTKQRILHIKKH